jgi:hypothetical protein
MPRFTSRKWSHFPAAYAEEFAKIPEVKSILEIGVAGGGSMQYWREKYPKAKVYGIDIDPRCKGADGDNIKVFIGSQADRNFLREVARQIEPPDIIVDDGCHRTIWQKRSFEELWPFLKSPGCYCIEDLQTAYLPLWRFGNWAGSFLRYAGTTIIDQMNGFWHKPGPFTGQITAVNFRDAIVFVHKGVHSKSTLVQTGEVDLQAE